MPGFGPLLLRRVSSWLCLSCRGRAVSAAAHDVQEIKQQLQRFRGGLVTLTKEAGGVAVVTIDNSIKKNAFTGSMCVALRDIVSELQAWNGGKCVILRAVGGSFCSGADLSMVKQIANHEDGDRFSYFMQSTLNGLLQLPLVSVALIDGAALGGGAELATACDLRAFTSRASIGFVQARMGLVPGWGGGTRLVRLVGRAAALRLLLAARTVRADEALRIGLADHVFADEEIRAKAAAAAAISGGAQHTGDDDAARDDALLKLAAEWVTALVGSHPEQVVRSVKTMVNGASVDHVVESTEAERQLFKRLWGGEANLKALAKNLKHD